MIVRNDSYSTQRKGGTGDQASRKISCFASSIRVPEPRRICLSPSGRYTWNTIKRLSPSRGVFGQQKRTYLRELWSLRLVQAEALFLAAMASILNTCASTNQGRGGGGGACTHFVHGRSMSNHRPSYTYSAGRGHVGFSPTKHTHCLCTKREVP